MRQAPGLAFTLGEPYFTCLNSDEIVRVSDGDAGTKEEMEHRLIREGSLSYCMQRPFSLTSIHLALIFVSKYESSCSNKPVDMIMSR